MHAGFSLFLPFFVCVHGTEDILQQRLSYLLYILATFCKMLVLCSPDVLDYLRVGDEGHHLAKDVDSYHWVL